tara:strand:- start:323 stop:1372 length:1050 start_codon:yes stop_codon:yes gene_type:complete
MSLNKRIVGSQHIGANTILENNLIFIRSKDGLFPDENKHTQFSITLKKSLTKNEDELFKVIVQSAQIPYTFRNTNDTNNYIDYEENGILKTPIQIQSGNYNIYELTLEIQTQLNNNTSLGANNYTISYNQVENKITIVSASASNTKFLFKTGVNVNKSIRKQIGYTGDNDITINSGASSTSDSFVDLIRIHSLFIRSNLSSNRTIESDTGTNSDILVSIPITSNPLSMINYQYYEGMSFNLIGVDKINHIDFTLTDQNGNLIDLGKKINWELLLNIQVIKNPSFLRNPTINDIENEYIEENTKILQRYDPMNEEVDIEEIKTKSEKILEHTEKHKQKINNIKNEINNEN